MKKLEGHYDHKLIEKDLYECWLKEGCFNVRSQYKKAYSILIPPPNVTGNLHLGHALDNSIQDAIVRYQRLLSKDVLYLPGMDHAGIATQARVMGNLKSLGVDAKNISREDFLTKTWEWKDKYARDIHEQWKLLGLSLDYNYETFTLDDKMNKAVYKVFCDYFNRGLIYQGLRIINWDPVQQTALSNIEVIHKEVEGSFYYFKYMIEGSSDYLIIATTRPETMFADQCVVVNPKDERYLKYHHKNVINPVNNESIPIILDEYVDVSFGTGVMKCTPAHDMNDYKLGIKHNLKMPLCMNPDGTMNELALEMKGLDRFHCRGELVEKMEKLGALVKIEKIKHNVGFSERSDAIVEPYLSKQWFVKMKPLADQVIMAQKGKDKIKFYPRRFEKVFLTWMENIEDWCISRQLWWGHRIPAYYHKTTNRLLVSEIPPKDIENYDQDNDVFDTWFSSGLWPFATLGWPLETPELHKFFPNSALVTAYDIIFFWVSRMIFQSKELTGKKAFDHVVIHGLIRDSEGQKMSKSKGNGVDPRIIIDKHGTDSLRHYLLGASQMGQDINFSEDRIGESTRYFDKLFNVTRFVSIQLGDDFTPLPEKSYRNFDLNYIDSAILSRLNETIKRVKLHMNSYRLNLAIKELYNFVYDDFCSNYVEMSKVILQDDLILDTTKEKTKNTLYYVLKSILIMLSPFAPYVTETLYLSLPETLPSINFERFPKAIKPRSAIDQTLYLFNLQIIKEVRNIKSKYNLAPKEEVELLIQTDLTTDEVFTNSLLRFLNARTRVVKKDDEINQSGAILISLNYGQVYVKTRLTKSEITILIQKQIEFFKKEVMRGEGMLHNENFVARAPREKILEEEEKLKNNKTQLDNLNNELKSIQ